jgi:tetratricopeptide (TPR) repeat protein
LFFSKYQLLHKLAKAEKMHQRALQGYEKALGADHTSTLDIINHLGILYNDQGKLAEADKLYQRAPQGYEKVLGPDHQKCQSLRLYLQRRDNQG